MSLILALLTWGDIDAARLGADSFDVRHAAHARLERTGWLAYPALWKQRLAGDPEARHRARRLLRPCDAALHEAALPVLAAWLFFGPDEWPRPNQRYLCTRKVTGFVAKHCIDDATMLRLALLARRWGYLDGCWTLPELRAQGFATYDYPDARWSWINVVRWRVIGNREQGKGM